MHIVVLSKLITWRNSPYKEWGHQRSTQNSNELFAFLLHHRSTLNLSRGHLDNTGKSNHNNSINIGYVQGIDTSRANINRLTHSSRDINRLNHVATPDHYGNASMAPLSGNNRDARTLLLTLQGSRAVSRQNSNNLNSPVGDESSRFESDRGRLNSVTSRFESDRDRLDSVTSRCSVGFSTPRPRSHCFQVEPVSDSMLDVNSSASNSAGQNCSPAGQGGMTNASFVIDMNNTLAQSTSKDVTGTSSSAHHHVGFNTVPQIIKTPPEGTGAVVPEPSANQVAMGDREVLEPLSEVHSDQNSSTESLQFMKPDLNQCTVTSLTPLLSRDSSDSEPEPEAPSGGNNANVV